MEGTLIGDRYRLSQPIGRGRAGFAWIAQDTRVHRTVVAKPVAVSNPQDISFALEQAKHAARLRHRCAVTVYDVFPEGPEVWLITEYVPSRSMAEFLTGHVRLGVADTTMLGTHVSAAVAAAHEIGLLHRAIEPSNILLADDGGVLITNFGIGGLDADADYQAPEVVGGSHPTPASDVFSLGATLFYAAEGYVPFTAGHETATFQHLAGTPLQPLLARMLFVDPTIRPAMAEVWSELRGSARTSRTGQATAGQHTGTVPLVGGSGTQPFAQQAAPAPGAPERSGQPAQSEATHQLGGHPADPRATQQPGGSPVSTGAAHQLGGQPMPAGVPQQLGEQPAYAGATRQPSSGAGAIPWPHQDLDLAQPRQQPPSGLRALGLPSPAVIAAAVVLAVLVGMAFAELVLIRS
ncbi:serine/threonine-protein kinase [Thermocrispum agreste]|jgi:hypothetical protein|uniref:serine/threonine-protein kinase n=1 Tax=Thermocrispum agreste TaxID=37925 RepID=UPI000400A7A0|nr:serine/threonine-protein kinase [Thermocrispum agreste]